MAAVEGDGTISFEGSVEAGAGKRGARSVSFGRRAAGAEEREVDDIQCMRLVFVVRGQSKSQIKRRGKWRVTKVSRTSRSASNSRSAHRVSHRILYSRNRCTISV